MNGYAFLHSSHSKFFQYTVYTFPASFVCAFISSQFLRHLKWIKLRLPVHLQGTMHGFSSVLSDPQQYLHCTVAAEDGELS